MVRNNKALVVLLLLVAFVPMATFLFQPTIPASGANSLMVPVPGTTTSYAEDFGSQTFRDGGATTAQGWGMGTLTSPRDYQLESLDNYTLYPVHTLDVHGRKIYAMNYKSTGVWALDILNITDPTNLVRIGYGNPASYITASEPNGPVVYLGNEGSYLRSWDVSNPSSPVELDNVNVAEGIIFDIEIQGHFLYVALDYPNDVIHVYDVEDPANMVEVYALSSESYPLYGLEIDGDLIYMAHAGGGLIIWNFTTPYDGGSFISTTPTAGEVYDVLVDGNLAYLAGGSAGVAIFDVSDPSGPVPLGAYNTAGIARRLALHGNTLYVADYTGGLVVLDVADPTHPTFVDSIDFADTYDVSLYGPYVVIGTGLGVHTLSLGAGIQIPEHWGTYSGGYDVFDVRVQDDVAYIAAGASGLLSVDISDPANPSYLDEHVTGSGRSYRKLDIQGHKVFVADYGSGGGLQIYDISEPANLRYLGKRSLSEATDVAVAGDIAYVADGTYGLYIVNISNPFTPTLQDFVSIGGANATAVAVQGQYCYVVTHNEAGDGIYAFDVTDHTNIVLADSEWSVVTHRDLYVDGNYLLGADEFWVWSADVTNPNNIQIGDTIANSTGWDARGVWGYGPYALYAMNGNGTYLWDTSDIDYMKIIGRYTGTTTAVAVTIDGDFAYIANNNSLHICRIYTSSGYHYTTGNTIAQSTTIDVTTETIVSATLTQTSYIPVGTSVAWSLSADGGTTWESVTPGVLHAFATQGSDLRFRAEISTSRNDHGAHVYNITIAYTHTQPPTAPVLTDPGTDLPAGNIMVSWSAATDPDGTVDSYQLQSSNNPSFTVILATYPTTSTNYNVTAITSGIFYFRVRAIDNDGALGPWSNVEDITITGGLPPPPPIPGFPVAAIALGTIIALSGGILYRRRKR